MSERALAAEGQQDLAGKLNLVDVIVNGLLYFVPMAPVAVFGVVYNLSNGMPAL